MVHGCGERSNELHKMFCENYIVEPLESYKIDVRIIKSVGTQIKIKWTKDEIGDSNWKPVWYAEVQESDIENNKITVQFVSEPTVTYDTT